MPWFCGICFETIAALKARAENPNNVFRQALPCGHTFCSTCVRRFSRSKQKERCSSCPSCRSPYASTSAEDALSKGWLWCPIRLFGYEEDERGTLGETQGGSQATRGANQESLCDSLRERLRQLSLEAETRQDELEQAQALAKEKSEEAAAQTIALEVAQRRGKDLQLQLLSAKDQITSLLEGGVERAQRVAALEEALRREKDLRAADQRQQSMESRALQAGLREVDAERERLRRIGETLYDKLHEARLLLEAVPEEEVRRVELRFRYGRRSMARVLAEQGRQLAALRRERAAWDAARDYLRRQGATDVLRDIERLIDASSAAAGTDGSSARDSGLGVKPSKRERGAGAVAASCEEAPGKRPRAPDADDDVVLVVPALLPAEPQRGRECAEMSPSNLTEAVLRRRFCGHNGPGMEGEAGCVSMQQRGACSGREEKGLVPRKPGATDWVGVVAGDLLEAMGALDGDGDGAGLPHSASEEASPRRSAEDEGAAMQSQMQALGQGPDVDELEVDAVSEGSPGDRDALGWPRDAAWGRRETSVGGSRHAPVHPVVHGADVQELDADGTQALLPPQQLPAYHRAASGSRISTLDPALPATRATPALGLTSAAGPASGAGVVLGTLQLASAAGGFESNERAGHAEEETVIDDGARGGDGEAEESHQGWDVEDIPNPSFSQCDWALDGVVCLSQGGTAHGLESEQGTGWAPSLATLSEAGEGFMATSASTNRGAGDPARDGGGPATSVSMRRLASAPVDASAREVDAGEPIVVLGQVTNTAHGRRQAKRAGRATPAATPPVWGSERTRHGTRNISSFFVPK